MYLNIIILLFTLMTSSVAFVYFNMFVKSRERFVKFWGICWLTYSASLILLNIAINKNIIELMEIRKICDMYNILFLLFGCYSMAHIQIPSFWYRFSLYLSIWVFLGAIYKFTTLSLYIPVSLYQYGMVCFIVYIVIVKWDFTLPQKIMFSLIFSVWGLGKASLSLYDSTSMTGYSFYIMEIIFSNLLYFSIIAAYLQYSKMKIASSARLYRIITENASDVILYYSLQPRKNFTYISPSVEDLTGYVANYFYNDPKFYMNITHPDYFNDIDTIFSGENESNNPVLIKIVTKDDIEKWVEFHSSVLYDENGNPEAIESFVHDITLLKDAENELKASKHARDVLLSSVSHELKTPVTSINGYSRALLDNIITSPEERENALQLIYSKSLMLERLINDLFQLSKLETNQFSFQYMEMTADVLCRQLIEKHSYDVITRKLDLSVEVNYEELKGQYIICDPERINQVFSNLLYNAFKHSFENGKIIMYFQIHKKPAYLLIGITDTGTGISPEDLPHIFERFYKSHGTNSVKNQSGSGLGLTISKEIIEAHGGTINVKSTFGKGASFYFTIPIYED